jgi:hypothetical protein
MKLSECERELVEMVRQRAPFAITIVVTDSGEMYADTPARHSRT